MLKKKFLENNYSIIKRISENVSLIEIDKKKYILKEISVPLSRKRILEQHDFIKYLISNRINTAKIISSIFIKNKIYEIQEYIEPDNSDMNIERLIKFISKFHNVSSSYKKELSKKQYYKYKFICRNYYLDNLLLGFKQKYYIFPRKKIFEKYNLVFYNNRKYINEIIKIYDNCYKYFITHYSISDCIIHNDITSNNIIISKNDFYIIDFDLAIKSSIYVDFVDCILKRYDNIYDIFNKKINILNYINTYVDIYNKYSQRYNLTIDGVLAVIILKIISFNGYVLLNEDNYKEFNNCLKELYLLINKMYNLLKEVKI